MKIGVFTDIHCNYLVFKKAHEEALNKGVEMMLFLGDHLTDGFEGIKIIDLIKSSNGYTINGNRELSLIEYDENKNPLWEDYFQYRSMKYGYESLDKETIDYVKTLPMYKIIEVNNKKICMSHGTPYDVRGRFKLKDDAFFDKLIEDFDCDIYLFGHEHNSFYKEYKNKYFINPGSIGIPTDGLPFKYGILTIDENIKYEQTGTYYDYNELEKHYKNSEYYKNATIWCELLLLTMKTGRDYMNHFMKYVRNIMKNNGYDEVSNIPDDIFTNSYNDFIEDKLRSDKMLTIYCYDRCSTCKKALKFLNNNNIKYNLKDIKIEHPNKGEMRDIINKSNLDIKKFFNTSGNLYKELDLKNKLIDMDDDSKIELLVSNGMLIKRPLVIFNNKVFIGFNEELWKKEL